MSEPFKVALVGPTGVGKTTLVTAILSDTDDLLASTPVSVVADEKTDSLVRANKRELYSAIAKGTFDPKALTNTSVMSRYDLMLQPEGDLGLQIPFSIMDYPGGWLDPGNRTGLAREQWPLCEAHVKESIMLLLPVDAAIVMEAETRAQRGAVPTLLGIVDVEQIAARWARARAARADEPAVVVLAPLKCEKYFDDNGGSGREAAELEQKVAEAYGEVLRKIRKQTEGRDLRVVYAPIDTYGCVHLMEKEWREGEPGQLEFTARYRFRGRPPQISVKAARTVMQELSRCLVAAQASHARRDIAAQVGTHQELLERKAQDKGFWGTLGFYLGGEAWENRQDRKRSERGILSATTARAQLEGALRKLASAAPDARVREW